jgi:hypothetical protein
MFTGETSPKIRRIQNDARATFLVAAEVGEKEEWVAMDGQVAIHPDGAIELAARLAERYWDLNDPERAATLQQWRDQASALRRLEIIPSRIRSYTG